MVGALGGYTFEGVTWKPGLGGIFYWGSGDSDPTTGDINTFNSLYPLGHAHWGQIDNFSGQNCKRRRETMALGGKWRAVETCIAQMFSC